ncbi:hypothetical protein [Cupriavidus necator]|uniref:hypothetical protein n=1 Tax=Cupriavidus necator TaxID=106590 RepID=UPI00339D794E
MGLFDSVGDAFYNSFGDGDHSSPLGILGGAFQKYTDPIAMIAGDKWVDLTSNKIPTWSNEMLSKVVAPFDKVDETINPVRRIGFVDEIGDVVKNKPASAIGTAIGAIFAAPALPGAGGAGAAGGAAGGMGTTGIGAAGYGGGVSSTVLPGVFSGAVVPASYGGAAGGLGAFGGAAGTGSITGAGAAGGLMMNPAQGVNYLDMARRGYNLYNQSQQQQQPQGAAPMPPVDDGGGNTGKLFNSLARSNSNLSQTQQPVPMILRGPITG